MEYETVTVDTFIGRMVQHTVPKGFNPTLTPARYMQWLIPDKIIAYRISA
jgi:hypothetical protein